MAKTVIERKAVDLVYHAFGLKHIISLRGEQELQWLKKNTLRKNSDEPEYKLSWD